MRFLKYKMKKKGQRIPIGFVEAMIKVEDVIWCAASDFNALMKIDLKQRKIEYINRFPDEKNEKRLFSDIIYEKGKLYFVPMNAEKIVIYDILNEKFSFIEFNKKIYSSHYFSNYKFCRGIMYNKSIFLICATYPAFIRVNLSDNSIEYIDEWVSEIEKKRTIDDIGYFTNYYQYENIVYIPCCCCNIIVEFNMENLTFIYHEIGRKDDRFSDFTLYENEFWVSLFNNNEIIKLNKNNWKYIERKAYGCDSISIEILELNRELFLFPFKMNEVINLGKKDERYPISEFNLPVGFEYRVIKNEDNAFFFLDNIAGVIKFNGKTKKYYQIIFEIDEKIVEMIIRDRMKKKYVFFEKEIDLVDWIMYIRKME